MKSSFPLLFTLHKAIQIKYFGCYSWSKELRGKIMKESGLPISFGLSVNKLVSKVGTGEAKPLTGYASVRLQSSTKTFSDQIRHEGMIPITFNNMDLFMVPPTKSWFALENIDFTGVGSANLLIGWQQPPKTGLTFEMRLGSADGELLGSGTMPTPVAGQEFGLCSIRMKESPKLKDQEVYFVYVPEASGERGETPVALINVSFAGE